jgi:hypothetical protein
MRQQLILILLFLFQLTFSQSISSYMLNIDKIKSEVKIAEIVESTTFYYNDNINKDIEYKTYDSLMNILILKRFDDNNI